MAWLFYVNSDNRSSDLPGLNMQVTAPLSINNGAATPVAVTFGPERVAPEKSTFVDRTTGVSALFPRLTVAYSAPEGKRTTNRIDINFDYPVGTTINGVSSVASIGRVRCYAVIPDTFSASDRANLHAFFSNALQNATVKAVMKDLDPMY
jgi:hypothetical protein